MYTIEGALELVYQNSTVYWWTNDSIYKASLRTSLLGSLFYRLSGLLLVMTLVELGNGFLFCLTETRTALQKAMRNAGIASCIVLFVIAFASFGVLNEAYSQYLATPWAYDDLNESLFSAGKKLSAAFDIILFAWAVVLMVFAGLVFKKIKHNYVLKNVSFTHSYRNRTSTINIFERSSLMLSHLSSPLFSSWPRPSST